MSEKEIYRDGYEPPALDPEVFKKAFPPKTDEELTASVNKIIREGRRRAGLSVDTGEMQMPDSLVSPSIRDRTLNQKNTLDYVLEQEDVNAMNKLSRKVGAVTSSGNASGKEWKDCITGQLAKEQCSDGYKIGLNIPVKGKCRVSHGLTDEGKTPEFFVPSTIKAPMTNSNKIVYTEHYDRLKNIVASNDGPDHMDNVNRNREFAGKTARCELYGLETRKGGRKSRGRKRGRKTRDKKRVKKTRTKKKHVKKTRGKKRGRKTHGRKISKKRGTRKRSYRKRR